MKTAEVQKVDASMNTIAGPGAELLKVKRSIFAAAAAATSDGTAGTSSATAANSGAGAGTSAAVRTTQSANRSVYGTVHHMGLVKKKWKRNTAAN